MKESQPHALMSSYNLLNGEHSCNSRDIQTHVLCGEWGYEGVVMTDWFVATREMGNMSDAGGSNKYTNAFAAGCVKACNDITMPGNGNDREDILAALKDESHPYALTRAHLQACAKRVLEAVLKFF